MSAPAGRYRRPKSNSTIQQAKGMSSVGESRQHSEDRYSGMSGRRAGLFKDTDAWIERLKNDAHWARTAEIRNATTDQIEILEELKRLALQGLERRA